MTEIQNKQTEIAAVILAGGNARRLGGIAKGAIADGEGTTIIARLIDELARAGISDVVIVANDPEPYRYHGVQIIPDVRPGIGPMGGIEAGLHYFAERNKAMMFLPCDLPYFSTKEISVLKNAYLATEAPAVFAATTEIFWHPLCAVVHNGLAEIMTVAIDGGERQIKQVWLQVKADMIMFDDETPFFNVNSSADIEQWRNALQE